MKTLLKNAFLLLLLTGLLNSCFVDVIEFGNGELIEESRTIPEFDAIQVAGSMHVYFEYAENPEVLVSCESNLMQYIETAVSDTELIIRTPFNVSVRPTKTIEVYVKGPYVDELRLSGSGMIYSSDVIEAHTLELKVSGSGEMDVAFEGEELFTKISGSGDLYVNAYCSYSSGSISGSGRLTLEGAATDAEYQISGSGKILGYDFPVETADLKISGSGDAFVHVHEYLYADISGSGSIHYLGDALIQTRISGSGKIIDEN